MGAFQNLDLLSVGITIAATLLLGFAVYISNRKSVTNQTFALFALITALWGLINYFSYKFADPIITLWLQRGVLFFAIFQAFFLYRFFAAFPESTYKFSLPNRRVLTPIVLVVAVVILSPFTFTSTTGEIVSGEVSKVHVGLGIILFALVAIGLVIAAIYELVRKLRKASGSMRTALLVLCAGVSITFALIIICNLVLATAFNDPRLVPLGALFTFPFIAAATYAILREHLFNIKVIGTSILVFLLAVVSFAEIIFSNSLPLIIFRISVFVLILIFGINLIQSVLREIEQRERLQELASDLEKANEQQVVLIHFITHQLKGFVTKSRNIFSMLLEGDYGTLPDTMRPMVEEGFNSDTKGAQTIQEILNAANIKSGKVTYDMQPFDLRALINEIITDLRPAAQAKGLELTFTTDEDTLEYTGDRAQLTNAFKNLIDNSIKYTPSGSVNISLKKNSSIIHFEIKDTGVGITKEDMAKLFTEGGHGAESQKVNVDSTGFGLYIVKNIIEVHKGKVWAESDGPGKGAQFIVELPL